MSTTEHHSISPERHCEATQTFLLAVNGTLMRGLKLNPNMHAAGAAFIREAMTEPVYRLWTINDDHPAMIRVTDGTGVSVAVEIWSVPPAGLASILQREPPGLTIGKVRLDDATIVLGVIGEPALVEGQKEITKHGGWRAYIASEGVQSLRRDGPLRLRRESVIKIGPGVYPQGGSTRGGDWRADFWATAPRQASRASR